MDSVRQQLESFRFPSPTPTIRSHKIWSTQHLEPYIYSPKSTPSPTSLDSLFDGEFVDSAYASPSPEAAKASGVEGMTLQDTLSELESIVRKYEEDNSPMEADEPKSFWDEESDEEDAVAGAEDEGDDNEDDDYEFVDEAYDSGCFTEDDETFETKLASLQPPSKRPRLSEEPEDLTASYSSHSVTIVKPSASLRLSKRMKIRRRQLDIPRSTPGADINNLSNFQPPTLSLWSPKKPSPAFIDSFQF